MNKNSVCVCVCSRMCMYVFIELLLWYKEVNVLKRLMLNCESLCLNDLKEPVHENHLLTWIIWLHYIHNFLIISIHNQGYYS